ncbi:hypothetical protein AC1031_022103 [Aphanomyces cochlioides]|nr:hypothetical protein AC1031_022103 [Aphanomyces cochlioides]
MSFPFESKPRRRILRRENVFIIMIVLFMNRKCSGDQPQKLEEQMISKWLHLLSFFGVCCCRFDVAKTPSCCTHRGRQGERSCHTRGVTVADQSMYEILPS